MSEIRRINRNRQEPAVPGEGDVFMIPSDILPDNLESGQKVKLIVEGTFNKTDEGGTMQIDAIYPEKKESPRTDPLQDSIEKGFDIEISLNKS